ncbi:hypothetical protein DEJ49_33130 [Streptomyces venezuelae]|uniref:Uncharacterized protein n=1 Tax=Streptomyces venezuelae TaxID=54571 RepID=A0A5P2CQL1_STRVZ|nr:hypothetical protein [Streptomyces venezuelae]QES45186.1 hypothetical protein DEJ49_33130 [Streptomyces venezuelae]
MSEKEPEAVDVDDCLALRFAELRSAKESAAKWKKYADSLTDSLLEELGYDPDDNRPPSRLARDADGTPLFEVAVTYRTDLDRKGLAAKYPAIFAEFETKTPVKTIKPPQG